MNVTQTVKYIGVDDVTLDLFESQYPVPDGVSYNSYVIIDDKIAVMDTVDARATEAWLANLETVLEQEAQGRTPDYLVISHLEPDHAANIQLLAEKYPKMNLIGNAKTFAMLPQFFNISLEGRTLTVAEGDTVSLGNHTLQFMMAPMVHWPEVMVTYETSEKLLFSADGFGTFGAIAKNIDWIQEARRYYINIVGKYGASVQALLKKAASLDIQMICPLHGPVLQENLGYYIEKYNTWSSYQPEERGVVVAFASIHGNTAQAASYIAKKLEEAGNKVVLLDLSRDDMARAVESAFQYDRMILACATYDGGMFPCMEDFLHHLVCKNYQNRKVGLVENGSWGPIAAKKMREILEKMKNIHICDTTVTIRSTLKEENEEAITKLVAQISDTEKA